MKKSALYSMAIIVAVITFNTTLRLDTANNSIQLECFIKQAQAESEIIGGDVFNMDEKLKSRLCILPLFGTRLICKPESGFQCKASSQTNCKGGTLPFI